MKISIRGLGTLLLLVAMVAVMGFTTLKQGGQSAQQLRTDRHKVSYALGLDISSSFKVIAQFIDLDALEQALANAFAGKPPLLEETQARQVSAALDAKAKAMQIQAAAARSGAVIEDTSEEISSINVGLMLGDRVIGPSLLPIKDEIELPVLMRAIRTAFNDQAPLMTELEYKEVLTNFVQAQQVKFQAEIQVAAEKNLQEGKAFLAQNKTDEGVITTNSGLQYKVLTTTVGARPLPGGMVSVHYEGRLLDGIVFDSSYERGMPASFGLNEVIPGWSEGVALMPMGSKYRFWVPSELGYGEEGTPGGEIGPNATLVFDVELLSIQ